MHIHVFEKVRMYNGNIIPIPVQILDKNIVDEIHKIDPKARAVYVEMEGGINLYIHSGKVEQFPFTKLTIGF